MKNRRYMIAYILLTNSVFISVTRADQVPKQKVAPTAQEGHEKNHGWGGKMLGKTIDQAPLSTPPHTQPVHPQEGQEKNHKGGKKTGGKRGWAKEKGPLTPAGRLGKIIFNLGRIKRELQQQEGPKQEGRKKEKPKAHTAKKGNKSPRPAKPMPLALPLPERIDEAIKHLTELKEVISHQTLQAPIIQPQATVQPQALQATPVAPQKQS